LSLALSRRARRALVCAPLAAAVLAVPASASPAAGTWSGKLDKYTSKLHFTVKGKRVVRFTVPEAPAYCLSGFSSVSLVVSSAAIHGSSFAGTQKVPYNGETENIALSGRFSGRVARGSVKMQGPCDGTFTWTAHR
jgi:hypothetical protein